MLNVLMVCLGNICRSPTAHGVFEKKLQNKGLAEQIHVDSCGTGDWHIGASPDQRSVSAAAERGYQLQHLRARQVQQSDFELFDYILAMDKMNLQELQQQCPPEHQHKIQLFLSFGGSQEKAVPDPYYSGDDGFELVLDLIEDASEGLLAQISIDHQLS